MKSRSLLILSITALALSACTKSSDSGGGAPAAAPTATPTAGAPGPGAGPGKGDAAAGAPEDESESGGSLQAIENEAAGTRFNEYTAASDDYLRSFLETKIESEKSTVQAASTKKSQQIKNATLKINGKVATASFEFFNEVRFGSRSAGRKLAITGTLNKDGEASLKSQHAQFSGQMDCLDQDVSANCQTRLVKINFDGAPVYVVFRQSSATFHVKFPEIEKEDSGMTKLLRLFKYAESNVDNKDALKTIDVQTVEVVRGVSKMQVILQSQDNEIVMMKFPLLPLNGQRTSVQVDRTYQPEEIRHLTQGQRVLNTIASSISDIQMVENDGRGNVTLNLNMKILSKKNLSPIQLSISRKLNKAAY